MRVNLAAMLAAIRAGHAVAVDERPPVYMPAEPLPSHPPIGPCGCDGSTWRPVPARRGRGYEMVRCTCFFEKHPELKPKPAEPAVQRFKRRKRDRIHDARARQFKD